MYKTLLPYMVAFLLAFSLVGQGSIVLVGGGSESTSANSWSDTPYQWAVDQSENMKVAIISYDPEGFTSFLEDYFTDLGALEAKNIGIPDRDSAQMQSTYDLLMTYDVFFFKGGNQFRYYDFYKNTKVTQAIEDKFAAGGVMMGTSAGLAILSEYVFTSEEGVLYPDQALRDVTDPKVNLEDDFVNILPNTFADSHFLERGRMPRLLVLAGEKMDEKSLSSVTGIGVDDKTAVCIDGNTATVYGTGAGNFYEITAFSTFENRAEVTSTTTQVLHGKRYNLSTHTLIDSYEIASTPILTEETNDYTILMSGSEPLLENREMLNAFLGEIISENMIVVTEQMTSRVETFVKYLTDNLSILNIEVFVTNTSDDPCNTVTERNFIKETTNYLFLDNDDDKLIDFLENHETGQVLDQFMRKDKNVLAFVGQDSRLVGVRYCTNNLEGEFVAYDGDLEFADGLGLLSTSIVLPNAYPSEITYYENNTIAPFYSMINDRLKYGVYINPASYVTYSNTSGTLLGLSFAGEYSSLVVENTSSFGGFSDQPTGSSGNIRQAVGFDKMQVSVLNGSSTYMVGNVVARENPTNVEPELVPPSSLTGTRISTGIALSWEVEKSDIRTGIELYRKPEGTGYELLTTLSETATSYKDASAMEDATYQYYIRAIGENQSSCRSNETTLNKPNGLSNTENTLHIYPNPIQKNTLLTFEMTIDQAQLYSLSGQKLATLKAVNGSTRLPNLDAGIYLLKAWQEDAYKEVKLVIRE